MKMKKKLRKRKYANFFTIKNFNFLPLESFQKKIKSPQQQFLLVIYMKSISNHSETTINACCSLKYLNRDYFEGKSKKKSMKVKKSVIKNS